MQKIVCFAAIAMLLGSLATGVQAATEVRMRGDAQIYGSFFTGHNFTGWNAATWTANTPAWTKAGTKTEEPFEIWERFRLRADFIANEALKFRLGVKVEDTWGHGTFTAANPDAVLKVNQAYLQFKLPGSDIEVTAGKQLVALPQSDLFFASPVFTDQLAALVVKAPVIPERLSIMAGYARYLDADRTYDDTTTQVADELDGYMLSLPVTLDGIQGTPWGMVAVAGKNAPYFTTRSNTEGQSYFADNLLSAGTLVSPTLWKNAQNVFWWAGGAFEVTALDPVKFYADVIYGSSAADDRKKSRRGGWFLDAGVAYTGWEMATPKAFGWYATGEDSSTGNGSERLPMIRPNWGPVNSFLFDSNQEFVKGSNMAISPAGSWGVGLSFDNISFVEKLTHRLTFAYVRGTNSPKALRALNTAIGSNPYFQMGRDLTSNEQVFGLNFDNKYMLYENLAAVIETGWAHGQFQESVWGHRLVAQSRSGDVWKVAFGLSYRF